MAVELNSFVERFSKEFVEVGEDDIKPDTVFRNLEEWSSMQALIIIAMIDEEYGVTLTAEDMKEADTVKDIFNKIQSREKQ